MMCVLLACALPAVLSISCGDDDPPTGAGGSPFVQTPEGTMNAIFAALRAGDRTSYERLLDPEFVYDAEPGGNCTYDYDWDRHDELQFFDDFYAFRPYKDGYVVEEVRITHHEPQVSAVPGKPAMRQIQVYAFLAIDLRNTETDSVSVLSLAGPQRLYFLSTDPHGQNVPGGSWKLIRWVDQGWSCWRQMRHETP
ncbi:MAG: hypothetical protein ACE15D_09830 [Candidatus Eisenbacteria bacterium]